MTQPNNVLNTQKHYDSLIEEAARDYSDHNYIDECVEIPAFKAGAIQMAQWKDEQLKQTREDAKSLYDEISDCIDRLVKSRLSKNGIGESNALQQMESIMVKTQQFLTYINEL